MTKFNPQNKEILTYGEALAPAMEITDQEEANYDLETQQRVEKLFSCQHPVFGKTEGGNK